MPFAAVKLYVSTQLGREQQPKITANGSYDREWLCHDGIEIKGIVYDVQIAECLLNEEQDSYSLDSIAFRHLGEGKDERLMQEAAWFYGDDAKKIMHLLASEHVGHYAEIDAERTLRTFQVQKLKLLEQKLMPIFQMESELSEVVFLMRQQGVRIDIGGCQKLAKQYRIKEVELYETLRKKFFQGRQVDFNSGKDLAQICQANSYHNFPRTPAGNPSFIGDWMDLQTESTCGNLAEFFRGVSEYRTIEKIRRDYLEGHFLNHVHKGRIHAQFHQMNREEGGTRSGRMAVSKPPLQGVPSRSKYAKEVKTLFLPNEGEQWLKHDYSQQEYRIFVHYAMLMNLPGAKEAGQGYIGDPKADFHQQIAEMTGLSRTDAKNWNFAAIYGAGLAKTAKMTKKTMDEAEKINTQYHEKVPYAKTLSKDMAMRAAQRGWIKTLAGRVLHFETYEPVWSQDNSENYIKANPLPLDLAIKKWPNARLKRGQVHKALNRCVQGSAADMTKIAMLNLYKEHGIVPLLQIHDELANSGNLAKGCLIKLGMETAIKLEVPVYADFSIGKTWGECEKLK